MKKIMNFRPVLICAASLCFGILAAYFLVFNNYLCFAIIVGLVALSFAIGSIFIFKSKNRIKVKFLFSIVFFLFNCLGFISCYFQIDSYNSETLSGMTLDVSGTVAEIREGDDNNGIILSDCSVSGAINKKLKNKVEIYLYNSTNIELGDRVTFIARLTERSAMYEGRFNANSVNNKIKFHANVDMKTLYVEKGTPTILQSASLKIREVLFENLEKEDSSVAYALICGNSDFIDIENLTNYRNAGIAHVFAVSGMHIGFLAVALNFIFNKLRINKYVKTVSILGILIFYAGICGFSASSLRATVMCAVVLFSKLIGSKYDPLSAISFAAIIVLLISPVQLFTVGFILSFSVSLGIILFSSKTSKMFKFLPAKLSSAIGVVMVAQIVAFPIMLAYFDEASLISVLTNLLFTPLVGAIYIITILSVLLSLILPFANVLLFVPEYIFKGINYVIGILDYDFFIISGITLGIFAVFYYAIILLLSGIINVKRLYKILACVILSIACVCGTVVINVKDARAVKLVVTNSGSIQATVIHTPSEDVLVISNASEYFSSYRIVRAMQMLNIESFDKTVLLSFDSKRDAQQIFSILMREVETDSFYYSGNKMPYLNSVFPQTDFYHIKEGEGIVVNGLEYFVFYGEYVEFTHNYKSYAICARFSNDSNGYSKLEGENYSLIIAGNYEDSMMALYNPEEIIAYSQSEKYKNAEQQGNIIYKIS